MKINTDFKSVDDYIDSQREDLRGILILVRGTIRRAVPAAQEIISYSMPTYLLSDQRLLHFAVWKQHLSIYASTERVVAAFHDELAPYKVNKGTIQFPLSKPVPVKLIARIAKFRSTEIAARTPSSLPIV